MTEQQNSAAEYIGRVLAGKYRVIRVLGKGGMGVVLEAENVVIQRRVALKILHANLTDNWVAVERFHREAEAAAATGHDHIVDILDMGATEEGAPFIVMELLDGETLQQLLRRERILEPPRAAHIALQALSALSAVHALGVVHRDLKPANIILVERGGLRDFVKLVDFGVAKIRSAQLSRGDLTVTGMVMGTPHYMAPEQARGARNIDHRADLYAMGAILYRCLSGRVPYRGANYNEILAKILAGPPRPLATLRPDLPPDLVQVVERAMDPEPDSRFQTAKDFAEALAEALDLEVSLSFQGEVAAPETEDVALGRTEVLTGPEGQSGEEAPTVHETPVSKQRILRRVPPDRTGPDSGTDQTTQAVQEIWWKRRRVWFAAVLLLAGLGLLSLGVRFLLRARGMGAEAGGRLRIGIDEALSASVRKQVLRGLAGYFERVTGARVETVDLPQDEVLEALVRGKVDVLFVSPYRYVLAKERYPGIRPLCRIRSGRRKIYQGFIVARVDSRDKRTDVQILRGKRFCWVSKDSTSGYLFPYRTLLERGFDPETMFGQVRWSGSHDKAIADLREGRCDAIAVFDGVFLKHLGRIQKFGVLAATDPIPQDVLVASPKMSPEAAWWLSRACVRGTGQDLERRPIGGIFSITGFAEVDDREYDSIRIAQGIVSIHRAQVRALLALHGTRRAGRSLSRNVEHR